MANLVLITQAAAHSDYSVGHLRHLVRKGLVKGEKQGGIWLIDLDDLQAYEQRMEELGTQKHTPRTDDPSAN